MNVILSVSGRMHMRSNVLNVYFCEACRNNHTVTVVVTSESKINRLKNRIGCIEDVRRDISAISRL